MTNPSDEQPDINKPAEGATPPAYGEQPPSPYGTANYGEQPPAPPYGTPPPPPAYGTQPAYGAQPYGAQAPYGAGVAQPDSGATTAMVLGIVGLVGGFVCAIGFLISPVALFLGMSAKKRIDAAAGSLSGRGNAQAGFILGIIGTVFLVLLILLIIGLVIAGINGVFDDSSSTYDPNDYEY